MRGVALGPGGTGPWMVESVELSRADYPELHAMTAERDWVVRRQAELLAAGR